jgi:outer membrane receptor for ferrienterochelin and colicin
MKTPGTLALVILLSLTLNAWGQKKEKRTRADKADKELAADTLKKQKKPAPMNTYTDIYQMIRHTVPGVVVSGKRIVVQGPNSFFGSSDPLFVVNGHRVPSIDYISPTEVKSIKLLKGSNANIYGNEGANGVISITLLSGSDK